MSGHLLGVFEPSVVLQVSRDAGCAPGGRSSGAGLTNWTQGKLFTIIAFFMCDRYRESPPQIGSDINGVACLPRLPAMPPGQKLYPVWRFAGPHSRS